MHLCGLSSDAPYSAEYEGVYEMSEKAMLGAVKNCLMRSPKVLMAFDLASNSNMLYIMCGMFRQRLDLGSILQK